MQGTEKIEKLVASKCAANDKIPKLVLELVGSIGLAWLFCMIYTGGNSHGSGSLVGVGMAAAIFLIHMAIGTIAKGFCNPIVALNDGIIGRIPIVEALLYVVVQFIGAFIGSGIAYGHLTDAEQSRYMRIPTRHFTYDQAEDEETQITTGVALGISIVAAFASLLFLNAARHETNPLAKLPAFNAAIYAVGLMFLMASVSPYIGGMANMAIDTASYTTSMDSRLETLEETNTEWTDEYNEQMDNNLVVYLIGPLIGLVLNLVLYVGVVSPALHAGAKSAGSEKAANTK